MPSIITSQVEEWLAAATCVKRELVAENLLIAVLILGKNIGLLQYMFSVTSLCPRWDFCIAPALHCGGWAGTGAEAPAHRVPSGEVALHS